MPRPIRVYLEGHQCPHCRTDFHTRYRLNKHVADSAKTCRTHILTHMKPLDPTRLQNADLQEKDESQQLASQGHRFDHADKPVTRPPPKKKATHKHKFRHKRPSKRQPNTPPPQEPTPNTPAYANNIPPPLTKPARLRPIRHKSKTTPSWNTGDAHLYLTAERLMDNYNRHNSTNTVKYCPGCNLPWHCLKS